MLSSNPALSSALRASISLQTPTSIETVALSSTYTSSRSRSVPPALPTNSYSTVSNLPALLARFNIFSLTQLSLLISTGFGWKDHPKSLKT